MAMARVPLAAPLRTTVASPTGGVGKTTITLGLGQVLAELRAERVAVVDAEPLGGTATLRVRAQPGRGLPALLWDLDRIERDLHYSTWARYGDVEHESRLTVFGRREPLDGIELDVNLYYRLVHALARHWPILVVDTGRPEGRTVLQAQAVDSADVLVVVCGSSRPAVGSVAGWLHNVRVPPQQRVGVVVARGGGDVGDATTLLQAETSAVVHVPVDRALDADASVPFMARTTQRTRDAFLELAALVMHMHTSRASREEQNTL
jgi:MinD-like ATPase involved in chromosome partitioning or flagellar assembly